jgi:hypothetical protein
MTDPLSHASAIRLESGDVVYDPRGIVDTQERPLAPRLKSLTGARLAVLDNTKWNGSKLLRATVEQLKVQIDFARIEFYQKESFSLAASEALADRIAKENDALLTAIGD